MIKAPAATTATVFETTEPKAVLDGGISRQPYESRQPPEKIKTRMGPASFGAPIGSVQFQAEFARCMVAEICSDLNTINLMPSLQMQNCLAAGSTVHRINHLLRNIP